MSDSEARARLAGRSTEQLAELHRLTLLYPDSVWHFADCDCCVCLHPDRGDNTHGYVINSHGESAYVEVES